MQKRTLAEMKAAYNTTNSTEQRSNRPNNYYPFWNMENEERAIIRFVPDVNEDNPRGFLVEKVSHNLTINGQRTSVPCLSMYEEECPICKLSQEYYKAKDDINGKKYYKSRQNIGQAIIVEDPLPADKTTGETHVGKLRYVALTYQLLNVIKEAFAGDDLEYTPDDIKNGYDFVIKKTAQGKYPSYTLGTKFQPRSRALTEAELEVVAEHAIDLSTLLPKNPGVDKVRAQLNADVNATSEEDESFDQPSAPVAKSAPAPSPRVQEEIEQSAPKAAAKPAPAAEEADGSMDDVLAAIRARRNAAKPA